MDNLLGINVDVKIYKTDELLDQIRANNANAVRDGHFVYHNADAGGTNEHPGTGFFKATISGGLSGKPEADEASRRC